jgi:hypothetical protein
LELFIYLFDNVFYNGVLVPYASSKMLSLYSNSSSLYVIFIQVNNIFKLKRDDLYC